jgi:hypothetical protein
MRGLIPLSLKDVSPKGDPGSGPNNSLEQAGYLELGGVHIYSVLHGVANPVARVLLVGPFASERYVSYVPWVRWARFLAARRIEALRFDYRGVGESTGVFEDLSFDNWNEDVEFLAGWLKSRSPDVPLLLHGLDLGALLASRNFAAGTGDALLAWGMPANGNQVLRRPLSRQAFMSFQRKSMADYVRVLEKDLPLEVEGYPWSGRLWRESFQFQAPVATGDHAGGNGAKPMRLVKLEGSRASMLTGSSLGFPVSLNPDLTDLFADNFAWIAEVVAPLRGDDSATSH